MKTVGEPSIVSLYPLSLTPSDDERYYGGDTMEVRFGLISRSLVGDGSRLTVSLGSNFNLNTLVDLYFNFYSAINGSLVVNIMNNKTVPLTPQVWFQFVVIVETNPGPNNDEVTIILKTSGEIDRFIYQGHSQENLYSDSQPLNVVRFGLGSSASDIGFSPSSPSGFSIDLFLQRVYNRSQPNNIYQTSFEPPLCYLNLTNPCFNNGTCIAFVINETCVCDANHYGTHCQSEIDACASLPCLSGDTCVDTSGGYYCILQSSGTSSNNLGLILGILIPLLFLLALAIYCCMRNRQDEYDDDDDDEYDDDGFLGFFSTKRKRPSSGSSTDPSHDKSKNSSKKSKGSTRNKQHINMTTKQTIGVMDTQILEPPTIKKYESKNS